MGYDRVEAKRRARIAMRNAYPHPMLVTLVYLLLTAGLTTLIMSFVSDPFSLAYLYLLEGNYAPEAIAQTIFTPGRVGVFTVMEILTTLYLWVAGFGYVSYALRLSRGEQPGYRNLLDGFSTIGRAILVNLLTGVFTALWSLIALVPYTALVVVGAMLDSFLLILVAIVILVVWVIFVSYRYRLAMYFLLDHPEMGALEAIRQSKQYMKGRYGALFVQDLSFLGWAILTPFTLGILSLWYAPYKGAADANFYNYAVYGALPDPMGPAPDNGPTF